MNVEHIIDMARQAGASDVHLVCGLPVKFRLAGRLENAGVDGDAPLSHDDCEQLARRLAGDDFDRIQRIGELDRAETIGGVRVRINLFRQQGHASAALRLLSDRIPALETLGLPPAVMDFPRIQRGIVVVTGETGSGKSTTLAALIDSINHTRAENIITMEDPIEYVYTPDQSVISQREIGQDTESYSNALRAVLREDPDVVLIGEMRDLDTIQTALTAATSCWPRCTRRAPPTPSTAWWTCSPRACSARCACSCQPRWWPCCRSSCCRAATARDVRWRAS